MSDKPLSKEERLALAKKKARELSNKFGEGRIVTGDKLEIAERLSFGVPELDEKTGGGIPYGAFTTAWGAPGSGKTTLGYLLTAEAQRQGKIVLWIALEKFDPERAKFFGVNLDELIIAEFPKAEESLDTIIRYAKEKLVDVIILDSIHSLSPTGEQEDKKGEKSVGDDTMALLARKLSQFFRMACDPIKQAKIAGFLIGQTRTSIGIVAIQQLTGGNALHHNSRLIIHTTRGQKADAPVKKIKTGEKTKSGGDSIETVQIGFNFTANFDKVQISGCAPEGTKFSLPFYYESGFKLPAELQEQVDQEEKEIAEQIGNESTSDDKCEADKAKEPLGEIKKKRGRPKTKG